MSVCRRVVDGKATTPGIRQIPAKIKKHDDQPTLGGVAQNLPPNAICMYVMHPQARREKLVPPHRYNVTNNKMRTAI